MRHASALPYRLFYRADVKDWPIGPVTTGWTGTTTTSSGPKTPWLPFIQPAALRPRRRN